MYLTTILLTTCYFPKLDNIAKNILFKLQKKRQVIWIERKLHTHQLKPGKKNILLMHINNKQLGNENYVRQECDMIIWNWSLWLSTKTLPPPPKKKNSPLSSLLADLVAFLENPVLILTQNWMNIFSFFFISSFW